MLRMLFCLVGILTMTNALLAQNAAVRRVVARYNAVRPGAKDLALYRLDWVDSLQEALQRAARENRPVCLIIIHAQYGDILSGHC